MNKSPRPAGGGLSSQGDKQQLTFSWLASGWERLDCGDSSSGAGRYDRNASAQPSGAPAETTTPESRKGGPRRRGGSSRSTTAELIGMKRHEFPDTHRRPAGHPLQAVRHSIMPTRAVQLGHRHQMPGQVLRPSSAPVPNPRGRCHTASVADARTASITPMNRNLPEASIT